MEDDDSFPLDYILNLHSIVVDYILPLINPSDLARLELVSKGCNEAIKSNGKARMTWTMCCRCANISACELPIPIFHHFTDLWRTMLTSHLRDHEVANRVFALLNINVRDAVEESSKYLFSVLASMQQKIALNLREKRFLSSSFTCTDAVDENDGHTYYRAIAIHNKGK